MTFHSGSTHQSVAVLGRRQKGKKFNHSISLFPVGFFQLQLAVSGNG